MQSSSNAKKAKVYMLFLLLFCFDDNSIRYVLLKSRLRSSLTICNYLQLFAIIR